MQYVINSSLREVLFTHNHPGSSLTASYIDKKNTRKINDVLKLFDVAIMDHIIITKDNQYVSILDI